MAFGKKNQDEEAERESKRSPDEWLKRAERIAWPAGGGMTDIAARNASVSNAQSNVSLVYEVRRTNELLEQLIAALKSS